MRRFTLKTMALALLGLFGVHGVSLQAQTWTGSTPSDANGKTVYLYNVGADKFLGKGGHWGTEACLNYEGTPFEVTYSTSGVTLTSKVKAEGSTTDNGKLTLMDGTETTSLHDSCNYFVDSNLSINNSFTFKGSQTGYQLSITSQSGTGSTMAGKTYVMLAKGDTIMGVESDDTDYSKWMIIIEDERRNAFQQAEAANSKPVAATFLMYDYDFARNDNSCSSWKTGIDQSGTLTFKNNVVCKPADAIPATTKYYTYSSKHEYKSQRGTTLSHTDIIETTENHGDSWSTTCQTGGHGNSYATTNTYTFVSSKDSITGYTYYLGNGYVETESDTDPITGEANTTSDKNMQGAYGKYWTANIHGASGAVTQTLTSDNMVRVGYYRVSCKGFTTSTTGTVRLWAASGDNGNGSGETITDQYAYTAIPTIAKAPETYVAASQTLENGGQTYDASVRVYVENLTDLLKFGIYVDGAESTAWTCFDNFAIEYLGNPARTLVLDEDQTEGEYIKNQATNDGDELQAVKLYLHRSMNVNTWNSLVLPVSLTVGQVKSAFGDQVRISEFKGAIDQDRSETIIFSKISASRDNNNDTAIVAGRLYLVKPTKAMPTGQTSITVPGTESSITDYYSIVGVTYAKAADVADKNYNDKVKDSIGYETFGSDTKVQFVGTYVKLTDEKIPAKSYVLNGNNVGGTAGLWYYRTVKTASKGFRGWLQVLDGETSTDLKYEIDGVTEMVSGDTTGIGDIVDGNSNAINGNIYNLSGQLVRRNATSLDGLAAGIYVSGGKKYVVK